MHDLSSAVLDVVRPSEHVMLVRLNRPAAANAMSTELGTALMTLFEALNLDAVRSRFVTATAFFLTAFTIHQLLLINPSGAGIPPALRATKIDVCIAVTPSVKLIASFPERQQREEHEPVPR